ncbi:MAG: 23S rRNA (guanosine(2251)-2'-O)-methyltransferase RlmB [Bacteroidetes bacterium]|nr:23S rRNA (guanosine(2251)-2'-O)-methyltransferase RlmB [Bacteroidota bacterium]MDA1119129.1 23S rRNA (guanosine(2251)-2'-O)-methyltransferase RlmB [Bacteroidota bacterium]
MEKRQNLNQPKFYPRRKPDAEMIFGRQTTLEAFKAGKTLEKLFLQKGARGDIMDELITSARLAGTPVSLVPIEKLKRLCRQNHQGVVGLLSLIEYSSLHHIIAACFDQGRDPFVIVLDHLTDIRNLGSIARSSECAGIDALILPAKGSAQINSDAMKASAGALNHLAICKENNLFETCKYLRDSGVQLIACTEKSETIYHQSDLTGPVALIVGSEEDGISNELLKLADQRVKIPMKGKIGSLNVSNASSILLFEILRQRTI